MFRRVRHKLAMIRYYSAPRPRTAWTRAQDIAFFVSFFLCLPATWIANWSTVRPQTVFDLSGWIADRTDLTPLTIDAWLANSPRARSIGPAVKITGNFRLVIDDHYRGWPLTTSVHRQPAVLDIDVLAQVKAQKDVKLDPNSPLRLAIERALTVDGQDEALESWQRNVVQIRQHWLNWFIAAGIWWILMVFASSLATKKRAIWRAEGKCVSCGYDLTGLEFNERCPECGALVT